MFLKIINLTSIEGDIVVRSEDFFSAIHTIMSNKQNRQRMSGSGAEVKVNIFRHLFVRDPKVPLKIVKL